MDVSVIIVNWNTKDFLQDCLKTVYEQAGNVELEVIVVDNASTDGSRDMVRRLFPKATLIANHTNKGYAAALNQGIRIGRGRYFLVLNNDTLICDATVEKTVMYADDHPDIAVVGCQVWESRECVQMTCFRFPSILNLLLDTFALNRIFKKNRFFGREHMLWWPRDSECQVDVVSGMFMLVRREAVDEVGYMDEAYFLLYEETDWCYRFSEAGWGRMFWPGAKIMHVRGGGHSRKKADVKMMVQFQKSTLIFFRKHYSFIQYILARLLLIIHSGLRCLAWALIKSWKELKGRNATYESTKAHGFWLSFKFCVLGSHLVLQAEKRL